MVRKLLSGDRQNCKSPRCFPALARWIGYRGTPEFVILSNNKKKNT